MSKTDNRRAHAKKRAVERYGLNLDDYDLEQMIERIRDRKATWVRRNGTGECVWDVKSAWGIVCRVVYDPTRMEIVTFLPRGTHGQTA